jgi:ABC-2 type transport system permease protein
MADEHQLPPSFSPGRKWSVGFGVVVSVVAALAIVVMVNFISRNYFFSRAFLSQQTRAQLSPQTLGLLKSLTNDVKVTLYYDKEDPMFTAIAALVNEYRLASAKISVETVDYTRDTAAAQKIKTKYKLDAPTDKDLVIFDCEGRVKMAYGAGLTDYTMEAVANETEREFRKKPVAFKGEMTFSAMLLAVTSPKPLRACYLTGHGEHGATDAEDQTGYLKFVSVVLQNYVRIEPLTLLGTNIIPADCNLLIIAAPGETLPEVELAKISRYLDEGGRLLALFNFTSANKELGLEKLLAKWGVDVGNRTLKDDQNSIRGQDIVISSFMKHPVVNALMESRIHLFLPRAISRIESATPAADAPKVDELAFTGPNATLDGLPAAPAKAYPVAVAVEKGAVQGLANERGTTRIVVTGDSLFLGNQMIDSAANRDFANYALNWLLDRTQLVQGLGPRPVTEYKLVMTRSQQKSAQVILLAALPGAILVLGVLVWLRRRS